MGIMSKAQIPLLLLLYIACLTTSSASETKPGCQSECGGVTIPYPFGTEEGCYRDEWFALTCNSSFNPPRLFIGSSNVDISHISYTEVKLRNWIARECYNSSGQVVNKNSASIEVAEEGPFVFSTSNKFTSVGCDTVAVIEGSKGLNYTGGCLSVCSNEETVTNGSCSGVGCCQTTIPKGLKMYSVGLGSLNDHNQSWSFNPCSYGFIVEEQAYNFSLRDLTDPDFLDRIQQTPVVLDWAVGKETCEEGRRNSTSYACGKLTSCSNSDNGPGYRCSCIEGYEGNPYLPDGCHDTDECQDPSKNNCDGICHNVAGGFSCSCPKGTHGDGRKDGEGCIPDSKEVPLMKIILGTGFGLLFALVVSYWLYWVWRKRRLMNLREKFFKQNGGLLLQQQLSKHESIHETTKIFTAGELERATENFAEIHIIGRGGYGTVYRGILSDQRVVAIKKSELVDESQIEQFINEVAILSQINHRNVVTLLGCCLETEVPLLVYEFIPNGTLFHHIHGEGYECSLSWKNRVRIAAETAGALAYLHSGAAVPIFHRDVKSTNILLDSNYTAKVSDFGASRLVPTDKTQITTLVQGTLGYLDPEYMQTSQLTDKSDVYSFGVVLVELLTGEMSLCFKRSQEERSLSIYFLSAMKNDRLFQIVEPRALDEGGTVEVLAVAEVAKRCLRLKGEERPTMKEVASLLEGLITKSSHPWVPLEHEEAKSLLLEPSYRGDYSLNSCAITSSLEAPR
ncbi:putative wall-associated receptor kinase-like 16 [Aristolochia californica]|uniref:putative wall-associated receptor kinase-like 16 n=1 Tax=Aristolochia californica TaxID=171875 RepID=UPI0035E25D91